MAQGSAGLIMSQNRLYRFAIKRKQLLKKER